MDDEIQIAAVEAVTESSSDEPPLPRPARRKRSKAEQRVKKLAADDLVSVQRMLCKASKCKQNCKEQFRGKIAQQQVLQFRRDWCQLHKTDQDEVVSDHLHSTFSWREIQALMLASHERCPR